MAQEITLPVKLQLDNLQSIVKEMRSQLGNLKVDSTGYKKLENVINGIEKKIQDIQVIASRPIMNEKQFSTIEKDISHIYDDVTKLGIEAGRIKFSDLQLTGEQKQHLQEFDNQLKTIKENLKHVEDSAKTAFLGTDLGKLWQENNPKDATKSFSEITKTIEIEVAKQKKVVEEAKAAYNDYQNTIQVSKNINSFMRSNDNLADRIKASGIFNQIFREKDNNFKNGGRNLLESWLKSEFSLSEEAIKNITQGSGSQVLKAFTEMQENIRTVLKSEQSRLSAERKTAIDSTNNGKTLTDRIATEEAKEQTIKATQNEAVKAKEASAQAEASLRKEEEATQAARNTYINGLTNQARGILQMGGACDQAKAQLASLNNTVAEGKSKLASLDQATSRLQGISNFVNRYVGAYAIIRKVSTAIRNAFNNIKELDKVITSIAVVTNMSQEDLWNKVGQYTSIAQEYGVATKDVYTVSQIFYQQGLQTAQVMDLTVETLKMAKIAGMEYSAAANAMTVAVRAFKIEMSDAQQVTDTYSALAAKFAVSSAEIANAMEKTASSAANVGMSLQSTSAFMSVMIQTTRESAQNIGSALKSIISRYGEMKASPSSLINVDGEEVAFNKVDTALASIGISIKDATGQFRDFDDVIMELAAKWSTLDNNTQRYIATVMAGNRQQSRFIALVSNYDELSRAMSVASNAENASIVQVGKTMDSLESKANQLKNAFSQLYLDLHIENGLKDIYDWLTRIITTVGKLGTLNGAIPTLMNIFGFGTGLKSGIKQISDNIQAKKRKIEIDNSEYQKEIERIENDLAKPRELKITTQVDDSQLQAAKNEILFMNNSALATTAMSTANQFSMLGNKAGSNGTERLNYLMSALTHGQFKDEDSRRKFLTEEMGMDEESPIFNDFMISLEKLSNSANNASNSIDNLDKNSNNTSKDVKTLGTDAKVTGEQTKDLGQKSKTAGQQAQEAGNKAEGAGKKAEQGGKDWKTGISKGAAIFSTAARLIGTAITAFGASYQDKSTDQVETSKLLTGVGNGLSMAGTGAQLGMVTGQWWGPIVGAIGGLLFGGLGAIIDGATMTIHERIALAEAEAKQKSDDALKEQSKVLDLSSSIENLNNLKKAMYNSTEDMQKYTDAMNTLGSNYPALITAYDSMGNTIIDLENAETYLLTVRRQAATVAREAAQAEMNTRTQQTQALQEFSDVIAQKIETPIGVYGAEAKVFSAPESIESNTIRSINLTGRAESFDSNLIASIFKIFGDYLNLEDSSTIEGMSKIANEVYYGNQNWEEIFNEVYTQFDKDSQILLDHDLAGIGELFSTFANLSEYDTFDYSGVENELNEYLKNNAKTLGLDENATVRSIIGIDNNDVELNIEMLKLAQNRINQMIEGFNNQAQILNKQVVQNYASEQLTFSLEETAFSNQDKIKIETNKIFSNLITQGLESQAKALGLDSAAAWSTDKEKSGQFFEAKEKLATSLLNDISNWSSTMLDQFIEVSNHFDEYLSADEILAQFNIQQDSVLGRNILESFIQDNQIKRNRILQTIFNNNDKNHINSELSGLKHFSTETYDEYYDDYIENNPAIEIAKYFTKSSINPIISKYADYFTTQLLDINKLAEDGYTNLASTRLSVLSDLAKTLSQIDDSKIQNELFATITSIDLSNYDTIVKAIDSIKSYEQVNGQTTETSLLIEQLTAAKNSLIFNVNTLVQDLTESISSAAKNIDNTLSTNKSGMDLSKALDQLASINATRDTNDILSFDDIFNYDATLGKYVYNQKGLIESINLVEGQLEDKASQLEKSVDNYLSNDVLMELRAEDSSGKARNLTKDALVSFIDKRASLSEQSKILYANLAQQFIDLQQGQAFTWEQFIDFLIEQGKDVADLKALTDEQLAAYQENKKNQLYQNIDWASIALDTDYFDTNKTLMDELAKELQVQGEYTWKTITEKYLDTIKNPQARIAAQNALNDSIIQSKVSQYQTAISEILNYQANNYLSQATQQAIHSLGMRYYDIKNSADYAIEAAEKFLNKLAENIGKAGYTLEQYNQDAGSILENTLSKQSIGKTLLDFASSDSINAGSLESLANNLNLQLTDLVDVKTGIVKGALAGHLVFNKNTGAYDITTSFEDFINVLNAEYGNVIDKTSQQYVEALKSWNDTQIEKEHKVDKAVTEELQSILKMQPGEKLNLAQAYTAIQSHLGSEFSKFENETLGNLGADFEDGILTIHEGADVQGIIQAIAQEAADAGALLPEEFEQIKQALVDALRDIANIISNGIDGSISADNRRTLENWAKDHNIGDLQFTETAEGFQLATESAKELYRAIDDINHLQGQVIFEKLKDNLIETDERFKSVTSSVGYTKQLQSSDYGLTQGAKNFVSGLNGNVDLYNRPVIQNDDGTISTIYTMTEESRHFESEVPWVMNITPITPEGEWLTDDNFHTYIQELIDETGGNMDEMIKLDKSKLGLIIEGENTEIDQQEKILDVYDERAEKLHEISAAIEENKNKSAEELALAQQINEARGLTEDDSFSFMDNEIPSGQNNPLNYWQSWSDAYTAIQDSISGTNKGTMDYTDFYNIITEMGNLTEITGQAITLGEQTFSNASEAADLITKAAGALQVQADGSLKIDLSQIGVDFASGADALNENVANGIQQLSASQIEMLDSLIGLLETIVTMEEAFKNLDVDSDMKLSFDELFEIDENGNIQFEATWNEYRETWKKMLDPTDLQNYSEDFARGMESIQFVVNDKLYSMADVIKMNASEVASEDGIGTAFYTALMNSLYQAALDGDYSETNIKELIMQHLQEGLEGTDTVFKFSMGNYTFIGTANGASFQIDWSNQATQQAMDAFSGSVEEKQKQLITAYQAVNNGEADSIQIQSFLIAEHKVTVDDKDQGTVVIDGEKYTYDTNNPERATGLLGAKLLDEIGAENITWQNNSPLAATGTIKIGQRTVNVEASDDGKISYISDGNGTKGQKFDNPKDMLDAEIDAEWKHELSEEHISDETSEEALSIKRQIQFDMEVEAGISQFELNSQSYQTISEESREKLETALASGNATEIQLAIQADPELSSLEGLSSSEIEEKLGLKEVKMKIVGDTEEATAQITTLGETVTTLVGNENKITVTADVSKAATSLRTVESKEKAVEDHSPINIDVKAPNASKVATSLQTIMNKQETINDTKVIVDVNTSGDTAVVQSVLEGINSQLMSIAQNKVQNIQITETTTKVTSGGGNTNSTVVMEQATGNVGLAKARGTLMGELGPELVVSNGKYFVAGQSGPEMVNLADDAIVFNHLQTEQLLKHGTSTGRGQAITNERNAVAFAGGNISGPAMASASSVLATLKQLRALWQSLQGTSAQDLAGLGGSGSGGGGGGDDGATARNSYLADVERWYNWLQKIAVLEEKINTEEAKRSKYQASMVAQGAEYAKSNLQTLKDLESEAVTYQALANTQQEFFNLRRSQLNDSAFSRFYTFDENGQLKYNDSDLGYKFLAELMARDDYGEAKYSAEQQYNMLVGAGMEAYMKYDSSGTEILMDEDSEDQSSFYSSSVQAFWDLVDSQKEEMQSLHDSIVEYGDSVIEKQTAAYEIMKEIEDNQISVEDKVLAAIEDTRQREIDELQNQRDAIEESANALIDGLSNQLQKEQDMYTNQDNANELNKLQRQLGILQRSGGSASQIASLQKEITQKQREAYFDAQQEQIDALKEASDNELARLDRQIELMTESLEYEKANGLLWNAVYEVMAGTPEEITNFITEHDSQYWGESPTKLTQDTRDVLFEAEQFVTYRDNVTNGIDELVSHFTDEAIQQGATEEAANKSTSTGSSGNGGGSSSGSDDDSSGSSSSSSSSSAGTTSSSTSNKSISNAVQAVKNTASAIGLAVSKAFTPKTNEWASPDNKVKSQTTKSQAEAYEWLSSGKRIISKFDEGGMIDEDQFAFVHAKESVLTPEQTSILRNDILSSKPTSLLSLLTDFKDAYTNISGESAYGTVNNTNGVTIEQAVVEMHVSKIANDYDAQRAGEQALEKMLTIARKTSGQNRIGR